MRTHKLLSPILFALFLVNLAVLTALAASPEVTQISFPHWMPAGATSVGQISFSDLDRDVSHIQFDVANGRYEQVIIDVNEMSDSQTSMNFSLSCTSYAQEITLAATLVDTMGGESEPSEITFTCGRPAIYNFDAEQNEANPINEFIPLNIFILDDGVTSLAERAVQTSQPGLYRARSDVSQSLETRIVPYLNGIWDQCSLGFELVNVWVADPSEIEIANGTLQSQLFSMHDGRRVLMHSTETGSAMRQGVFKLWSSAKELTEDAADAFNVMLIGAPIVVSQHGAYTESEGFSSSTWPNYAVSRLGAILDNVVPKQMIATLAHELGHNLDLHHPGEDDLYDTVGDHVNLMKGSGVAPQPRANLLQSQCDRANETYAEILERQALTTQQAPPVNTDANVSLVDFCADNICSGEVEIKVEASGFENLDGFSFASFEYSIDGERFYEIAVDRHYADGFSALWDTTELSNGAYTLRVVVTDSQGVRASVEVEFSIQN